MFPHIYVTDVVRGTNMLEIIFEDEYDTAAFYILLNTWTVGITCQFNKGKTGFS